MPELQGNESVGVTDEEVGKLWAWANAQTRTPANAIAVEAMVLLIRKLVEERALSRFPTKTGGITFDQQIKLALRDFHIDPASWEEREQLKKT